MPISPHTRTLPSRVIKVGGSLLDFEGLVPAFRDWHDAQPPAIDVLIAGGGRLTEAVRDLDERFAMEKSSTHWLCIRLLDVTARILQLLIPEAAFIDRSEQLRDKLSGHNPAMIVFSTEEFLQHHEPAMAGHRLTMDWKSTSDSIAARLAQAVRASELVLLKSALPAKQSRQMAAETGYVDAHFPLAAYGVPRVRCVDLRGGKEIVLVDGFE